MGEVITIAGANPEITVSILRREKTMFGEMCYAKASNGVTVQVKMGPNWADVYCRGTIKGLIEAGYLTRTMVAMHAEKESPNTRNFDENDCQFLWLFVKSSG